MNNIPRLDKDIRFKGALVSPNTMMTKAREIMLDGQEPSSREDWMKLCNFWAFNIASGMELAACKLLSRIFNAPLEEDIVKAIVDFQMERKSTDE